MSEVKIIDGQLTIGKGVKFAVLCGRFNAFIVDQLEAGHGVPGDDISVVRVPGAFEMPVVAKKLAASGEYDAIVALGAVIRGSTPHFDIVAGTCSRGLATVAMDTGVPIVFAVLTVDSIEQAIERAGTKSGNKGADAAVTAIEMVSLLRQL